MKIGIFNPYMDDLGGGEKYMMTIAECLSQNHDVTVFWDNQEDVKELLQRFAIDLSKVIFAKNIFSKNVSTFARLLETKKYDAIIVLSDGSIPLVLSKRLFLHFQQPMPHIKSGSVKTKFKLSRVTSIFCNSRFTKSFIDKSFNVNSRVVYPPVDLHPKEITKENIVLTVGRLRVKDVTVDGKAVGDYKKHSVMIDAFKQMADEGLREWRFVLGVSVKDEDRDVLKKMKKSAEGFPIEFVINKNNKQLLDLYNRAKIYWHATGFGEDLVKHPEYAEHFGIAAVEAMGAGAVPVVINTGGLSEIVQDGVNGLLWSNLEECIEKTKTVIDDGTLWERLSKEAKKRATYFSKNRFEKELYEILR